MLRERCEVLFAVVVVVDVVNDRGEQGSLQYPGTQQQAALHQLLSRHKTRILVASLVTSLVTS